MSLSEALTTIAILVAISVGLFIAGKVAKRFLKGQLGELVDQLVPVLIVGTLAVGALLIVDPDQADTLLDSTVRSVPRIVLALIIVITARGIGRILGLFVETALRRVSPVLAARARLLVSSLVLGIGAIIALQQVGISTDIILILVAAMAFGTALTVALAVGLGSVPLAKHVAAGRHVANRFEEGQLIRIGAVEGRIASIGLASTSVEAMDGGMLEVPNSEFLAGAVTVLR